MIQNLSKYKFSLFLFTLVLFSSCHQQPTINPGWPVITKETKPWTRWWWQGNALTKEGITAELEAYHKAGLGGVEITPIYGVYGYENKFVDFLSPQWMELLLHTLKEAERLDMGVDMATGTGWPFGGPWVKDEDACKNLNYKIYEVKEGANLDEKIEFIQQPFLRAIGNLIYSSQDQKKVEGKITSGARKEPSMRLDPKSIKIESLKQPVGSNKNLQELALEQVQFEKPLSLQVLMAYSDSGETLNLTNKVDASGKLNWIAPKGNWKLYAVFEGWHGKMVERAGPGGEGNVIDHFSAKALKSYLNHFDSAFQGHDISSLRAFFNDSYEVDDARGAADWTPELFNEFKARRGYDLRDHLPALFNKENDEEENKRVLCDYRETISELLLGNFTQQWKTWAHSKSAEVRNQAHGSPANILDLYAVVDIPEIEGIEPLRIKMASSAGNVTGKNLVSSESATWLDEHFKSNLGDVKVALDRFMLNGVNHLFYHGTSYSPPGEPWPGWLFYAAVHFNPRNSQWKDFDALNNYAARCQSFLQITQPDNDVLLYYPIYDRFSTPGQEMVEHFDGLGRQFKNTAFERNAEAMQRLGYSFDYISDKQIANIQFKNGQLRTEGNSFYKTIVIPHCEFIPQSTLQKLISLAEQGATIIATEGLPSSVSGYSDYKKHKEQYTELITRIGKSEKIISGRKESEVGEGRLLTGDSIQSLLAYAEIRRETMLDSGISYIRKKTIDNTAVYFIANSKDESYEGWLPLSTDTESVIVYDPMNGEYGKSKTRKGSGGAKEVYVQLTSKQSLILQSINESTEVAPFHYKKVVGDARSLSGKWKISFTTGGPVLPGSLEIDSLQSWTSFEGEGYKEFSGTASYTLNFNKPKESPDTWLLDLGKVKESAEVFINGESVGKLIGPVYQVYIASSSLKENNMLEIKVSNLMANRIIDMDKRNVFWKKFYNVNFPARKAENRVNGLFDASHWSPEDSGLLGPVRLIPIAAF